MIYRETKGAALTYAEHDANHREAADGLTALGSAYFVDATETDQGLTGGGNTLKAHIAAIGSSERHIYFAAGNYTLTTSVTVPSNITLHFAPGAVIDGAGSLTGSGGDIISGLNEIFGSSIAITGTFNISPGVVEDIATLKTIKNVGPKKITLKGYYTAGDGGGGDFFWDLTSTETDNGGTIIQATGVTTGRWKRINVDVANVKHFGAKGGGTTDDTLALQAAIDTMKNVYFPGGTYLSGPLTLDAADSQSFFGDGYGDNLGSILKCRDTTGDLLTVGGGFVTIHSLKINTNVTRTSGAYIRLNIASCRVYNIQMVNPLVGISVNSTSNRIHNVRCDTSNANTVGIDILSGYDLQIHDFQLIPTVTCLAGIRIYETGDIVISNCQIMNATDGISIIPSTGQIVPSVRVSQSFLDGCNVGLNANVTTATSSIVRCQFDNVWFGNNQSHGCYIRNTGGGTANGFRFHDCEFVVNGVGGTGDGFVLGDNVDDIQIIGGVSADNASSGVSIAANDGVTICGHKSGAGDGLSGNVFGGIVIAAGATNLSITSCNVLGNTGSGLQDSCTDTSKIIANNIGYNPIQNTAITVTASPFTFTNTTGAPVNVYINGGTVSLVQSNGQTVGTSTNTVVHIPNNGAVAVTYSVAPTMSYTGD